MTARRLSRVFGWMRFAEACRAGTAAPGGVFASHEGRPRRSLPPRLCRAGDGSFPRRGIPRGGAGSWPARRCPGSWGARPPLTPSCPCSLPLFLRLDRRISGRLGHGERGPPVKPEGQRMKGMTEDGGRRECRRESGVGCPAPAPCPGSLLLLLPLLLTAIPPA